METAALQSGRLINQRLKNFSASFLLILSAYIFYTLIPEFQPYASVEVRLFTFHFITRDALQIFFIAYTVILLIYYLCEKDPQASKSIYCLVAATKFFQAPIQTYRNGLSREERLGLLTSLLKVFFAPLMVASLIGFSFDMIANGAYVFSHLPLFHTDFLNIFNSHGFWFLLQLILFLDVIFFTIGYLVEMPGLKNQIRSVDPTLIGWGVALACYPPFNGLTSKILGWEPSTFPQFDEPVVHIGVNVLVLLLLAIYTSASVALNFKASNLTHRGIIASGPYRFVRHPAYTCKNLAWWLATIPAFMATLETSLWSSFLVLASAAGWTLIYVLRALTEEDHLRKVDGEYDAYCAEVRYRFVPGLL